MTARSEAAKIQLECWLRAELSKTRFKDVEPLLRAALALPREEGRRLWTCPDCGSKGIPYTGAPPPPQPTEPGDWTFRPGRFDVRASCPKHPSAPMRLFDRIARCSECGEALDLCGSSRGTKVCVREKGHPPDLHTSPSGSCWPVAPPQPTGYTPELSEALWGPGHASIGAPPQPDAVSPAHGRCRCPDEVVIPFGADHVWTGNLRHSRRQGCYSMPGGAPAAPPAPAERTKP